MIPWSTHAKMPFLRQHTIFRIYVYQISHFSSIYNPNHFKLLNKKIGIILANNNKEERSYASYILRLYALGLSFSDSTNSVGLGEFGLSLGMDGP